MIARVVPLLPVALLVVGMVLLGVAAWLAWPRRRPWRRGQRVVAVVERSGSGWDARRVAAERAALATAAWAELGRAAPPDRDLPTMTNLPVLGRDGLPREQRAAGGIFAEEPPSTFRPHD